MASSYSTNLAIELIGTGDQAGTWGVTTNTNLGTLIEQAISGYVTQAVATGTDTTITIPNGATGVARNMYIELTGTGGTNTNLIVPANKKLYFIFNNTASGQVTVKVTGQTGVSVPNKAKMILVSNGTDIVEATNFVGALSATSLTVSSGSTLNGGVVVNEPGADVDFRVEGDTDANLLFVDASTDRVGVGTNAPNGKIESVNTNSGADTLLLQVRNNATAASTSSSIRFVNSTSSTSTAGGAEVSAVRNANDGGALTFKTAADSTATLTERLRIDASGNLGLGVTPSAWGSGYKSFQITPSTSLTGVADTTNLATNYYFDGSNPKYITTGNAMLYQQITGQHRWFTAASGTAGNTISFTQAMTLNASGDLFIGATSTVNASNVLISVGSGASSTPRLGIFNTASTPTSSASTQLQMGFASGSANYVATDTIVGQISFLGQANDAAYGGASIQAQVVSGGNVGRASGHGVNLIFSTKPTDNTGVLERARITAGGFFKAQGNSTYVDSAGNRHEFVTAANNTAAVIVRSNATNGQQYGLAISTADDQNDATRYFLECQGSGTDRAIIRSNGGLANYSANNVNLASDERLKKDIAPLDSTWSKVKGIEVVNFRYKDCNEGDPALYGVIAQQVQPIVPELVVVTREAKEAQDAVLDDEGNVVTPAVEASPEYYGIREQPMYWLAIKALQEAMTRIEELEAKVAALEAK